MKDSRVPVKVKDLLVGPVRNGVYKPKEFHGRGVKIVNMGELFAYPRLRSSLPMRAIELSEQEAERFSVVQGDLLFARRSLVAEGAGKCSVAFEVKEPLTFESSIIRARPDRKKADAIFLFYLFNSHIGLHALDTIRRHVAVAGITGTDLSELEIPVPPLLEEQHRIADILSALDDKIDLNRRMSETLEAMARAFFKSWFVDFDPVRAKAERRWRKGESLPGLPAQLYDLFPDSFENSELGEIPKGWHVGRLEDAVLLQRGFDLPSKERSPGKYPIFAASGMSGFHNEFRVIGPGVVTGRSGVLGNVFYATGDFWPLNTTLWVKEFRHFPPAFAFYALRRLNFGRFNAGSAVPTLNRNHIHTLPTLLPPPLLVAAFEKFAKSVRDRMKHLESSIQTLSRMRDELLPRLISGELRIAATDQAIFGANV